LAQALLKALHGQVPKDAHMTEEEQNAGQILRSDATSTASRHHGDGSVGKKWYIYSNKRHTRDITTS
jgi:hypothetical protein